jgi:hypothetical protein
MTRFICLKQGHKYGIEYVNILHNRVRYYLPSLQEFICYTDTPDLKFDEGIEVHNLPTIDRVSGWWWKCWILAQDHPGENLYMDLDMLVTGDLSVYRPRKPHTLYSLWNIHHMNSSILGWYDTVPKVWDTFWNNRGYHLGRGGTWGDQDIINECVDRGDFERIAYPDEFTAWLNITGTPARNWQGTQKTIVCKGPRNPHENNDHPLVRAYWRKL